MKYTSKELKNRIEAALSHHFGVAPEQASDELFYKATVLVLLGIMRERRTAFRKETEEKQAKMVYYLSMEFLMGRSLKNNLFNLELEETMEKALSSFGVKLESLYELEPDAGLGNGGLGRLAACFLDSLTSSPTPQWATALSMSLAFFAKSL